MNPTRRPRNARAFTLVELLVATVVLMIILLMLVAMVNQTATIWRTSSAKVEQFRSARTAFESINRNLAQATLNTYYDYARNKDGNPVKYQRQSDLRFVVGKASELVLPPNSDKPPVAGPTHAIFFHAPVGFVSGDKETLYTPSSSTGTTQVAKSLYSGMDTLLNTWGYFIEYGSDYNYRPAFLNVASTGFTPPPERYRYRLMEFMVPADQMSTYWKTSAPQTTPYVGLDWFQTFLQRPANPPPTSGTTASTEVRPAHLLAENIIALVLKPQLSPVDQASVSAQGFDPNLAPSYSYNTAQIQDPTNAQVDPKNQLPPVVQVTMVAMDEASAARLARNNKSNPSNPPTELSALGDTLFQASSISQPQSGTTASQYNDDLSKMQFDTSRGLVPQHISYRIFTTNISLRAAKWSRD